MCALSTTESSPLGHLLLLAMPATDSCGPPVASSSAHSSLALRALAYSEFMTFTVTPVLKIDDAVGPIMTYLGG